MLIKNLDESIINDIGHAFGYYDYGDEKGLSLAFGSKEAVAIYISGYVRAVLTAGFLHATSEKGEGYIAYKLPEQRLGVKAGMQMMKSVFQSMNFREMMNFLKIMSKQETSLRKRMDKEKKPYIYVGLVCVPEKYQGQGFMRKVMEIAFKEGNRLQIPVILDTDAKSKCDKYVHLGMELAGTRSLGDYGKIYDLIKYPDKV